MLSKETKEQLEGFGFDVSKLESAIKSEKEESLDVPKLKKEEELKDWLSPEQKTEFGKNRFEEGKTAMSEIKAKELKEKLGVSIDGKDLDKVIEAFGEAQLSKGSKGNAEWINEKKTLQSKIEEFENALKTKESEYSQKLFNIETRNAIIAALPDDTILGKEDLATLFTSRFAVKQEDGRTVIYKGDQKLKDKIENPLNLADVVANFVDEGKYRKTNGMGGDDTDGGGSAKKFNNTQEFYEYAKANGIEPMSAAGQKVLADNKAEGFKY